LLIKDLEMERDGDKAYDVVERTSSYDMNSERGGKCRSEKRWKVGKKEEKTILEKITREEKEGKTVFYCWISLA